MKGLNEPLAELLKERGLDISLLAKMGHFGRSHLSQVINGRRPGSKTWKWLKKVLSAEEYEAAWKYAQEQRPLYPVDPLQQTRLALLAQQRKA